MHAIMNCRMARSAWPNGYKMNDCKTPGVMFADVVNVDTQEIVFSGSLSMCRGKIEMLD